jgi:hypothetical protein
MKKIQILGLALFAVFAFGAIAAASAFAAPEWLINGAAVTELTSVETKGSLNLTDTKTALGSVTVKCEGTLDGSVGPAGGDEITEVLNTAGVAIKLGGTALLCTSSQCSGTPEVWPENLPWQTQLELVGTVIRDHIFTSTGGAPGYTSLCTIILPIEDTCTGLTSSLIENMGTESPADVLGIFNAESEKGNCSLGGTGTGVITGDGLITTLNGLALAVSGE